MKLLWLVLIILLLSLQYKLWVHEDGVQEVWRLSKEVQMHEQEISVLRERNAALTAEVIDLKNGLGAIEERARSELGMIRKGETFYHLIGEQAGDSKHIQRNGNTPGNVVKD